jgi:hypothetical protein
MAEITGLGNLRSSDQTVTDDLTVTDVLTVNGNCVLGNAITDSVGFYGVGPVAQRASASQTAFTALTATTLASPTAVANKVNTVITYCLRTRTDLIALGLIKGAA